MSKCLLNKERRKYPVPNIYKFLEDPRYPSVGPHLRLLSITGLWHHNLNTKTAKFKKYLFYFTIVFFFSQYLKCLIKLNVSYLTLILQYAPFHMGIVKSCFFQKDHKKWENIIHYISSIELKQKADGDKKINEIINEYLSRSRKVSYFFWAMAFFSNFLIFSEPYQKNQIGVNGTNVYIKIFDGYTPFGDEPRGYYLSMFVQTVLGYIVSAYVVGWDTLICTIMIFFAGQLRVTRLLSTRVINLHNVEQNHANIAECHRFHTTLVKNQKLFNDLISPAMFVYLIVISVNLGVCIIKIAQLKNELASLISGCLFVIACLIQLLLFYWHSNEVTEESVLVSYGTFESNWCEVVNKHQREVMLLGISTRERLVFKAGPFNEMSLKTFIAIIRTSYSLYTLLNKSN